MTLMIFNYLMKEKSKKGNLHFSNIGITVYCDVCEREREREGEREGEREKEV